MLNALQNLVAKWFGKPSAKTAAEPPPAPPHQADEWLPTPADDAAPAPHPGDGSTDAGLSVPFDDSLLERARTLWRQGDWDSLIRMDMSHLEHHPDRARLSLVVATAWLQQGDPTAARRFLRHALDWGCDKKLIAQLLAAGVHNTLGRAAAIAGDEAGVDRHFRAALAGSGSAIERSSLSRRHAEMHRLGISPSTAPIQPPPLPAQEPPIHYPPQGITSYAQNFEDVMLWRALWDVEDGFYIDVGAWDPVVDSVSKAFYEKGWRGIHVEPLPEYADKIRQDRPDEPVYQVLLGAATGEKNFYHIPETGLSTATLMFAERHRHAGWAVEEKKYPVLTLAQLFDAAGDKPVHWLKIDVEGMEDEVLTGWGKHPARPWVVLIEATEPNSTQPTWMEWQHHLEERGYSFEYFDGLNRFYIHIKHAERKFLLKAPPNVFDGFYKMQHQNVKNERTHY